MFIFLKPALRSWCFMWGQKVFLLLFLPFFSLWSFKKNPTQIVCFCIIIILSSAGVKVKNKYIPQIKKSASRYSQSPGVWLLCYLSSVVSTFINLWIIRLTFNWHWPVITAVITHLVFSHPSAISSVFLLSDVQHFDEKVGVGHPLRVWWPVCRG